MKKIAAITAIFVAILLFVFPNVLYAVNEPATEIVKKVQIQIYDKNGQPVGTPLTIYNKETNEQSTLYKDFSESYIDVIEAGDSEPGSRRVPIYITSFPVKYETIVEFDSEALEGIAGGWTSVKNVFLWKRIGSGSLNCGWGEQYIGTRPVKFSPLPVAGEKGISRERIEGTNPNDDISPLPYIVHFQKNNYCKKNIFFNGNELSLEIVLQKQDSEIRYSSSFSFNHIKTLLPTLSCLIRFQDTNGTVKLVPRIFETSNLDKQYKWTSLIPDDFVNDVIKWREGEKTKYPIRICTAGLPKGYASWISLHGTKQHSEFIKSQVPFPDITAVAEYARFLIKSIADLYQIARQPKVVDEPIETLVLFPESKNMISMRY